MLAEAAGPELHLLPFHRCVLRGGALASALPAASLWLLPAPVNLLCSLSSQPGMPSRVGWDCDPDNFFLHKEETGEQEKT